jgi:putative transposase
MSGGVGLALDRDARSGCTRTDLRAPHRAGRSERRPSPEWVSYAKNSIWIYDCTHFAGCPAVAVVTVMDLVTRKLICEVVSAEETSSQVQVAFTDALPGTTLTAGSSR